ncbi:GNAT family N-acetyltransferase [Luedemannella helvata]|uniref:GNAT family N-acetyltransferase n=1 Tax=Luedemannella helvata TaxID=349315 RepID=A0ABN2JRE4_9ACTN
MLTKRDDGYEIDTDPARLDVKLVHQWLSTDAYWALGRPLETVERSIEGSLTFGVYAPETGELVGFARVITDLATFAYLCDVYIDRGARGHGLGTWLVTVIRDRILATGVRRLLLATADAHEVYARVGYSPVATPERWMEIDIRDLTVMEAIARQADTQEQ